MGDDGSSASKTLRHGDLRHTGNILTATAGGSLRELMARMALPAGPRMAQCLAAGRIVVPNRWCG
jgi:hypothetical protein